MTGVAPGAEIIPLRTAYSVLLWSTLNLARAIEYATNEGAHVISISMGGLWSWRLRRAVVIAQQRGVIICAASGNYAPFVGWPGAYDEVIACAALRERPRPALISESPAMANGTSKMKTRQSPNVNG